MNRSVAAWEWNTFDPCINNISLGNLKIGKKKKIHFAPLNHAFLRLENVRKFISSCDDTHWLRNKCFTSSGMDSIPSRWFVATLSNNFISFQCLNCFSLVLLQKIRCHFHLSGWYCSECCNLLCETSPAMQLVYAILYKTCSCFLYLSQINFDARIQGSALPVFTNVWKSKLQIKTLKTHAFSKNFLLFVLN